MLRQYAYEKLVDSGEEETVRMRHLKYFLRLSEQIESGLRGINHEEWFARALYERDNLHAALEQAAKTDIEAGLYISGRLEAIWERYDVREGAFWLAEFLQNPESKQYPLARARALCAQGWLLDGLRNFRKHEVRRRRAWLYSQAHNDQPGEIDALILTGGNILFSWDRSEGLNIITRRLFCPNRLAIFGGKRK